MLFEQLRTGRADHEERHRIDVCRQMFDEGEQAFVGPVEVLQHDDQRLFESQLFDEAQPGGEVLLALGRRRLETEQRPQAVSHPGVVVAIGHDDVELRRDRRRIVGLENAGLCLDDLRERPIAHPLTVGWAAAQAPPDHLGSGVDVAEQLVDQPGLADAGFADDEGELGRGGGGLVEQFLDAGELRLAANKRCKRLVEGVAAGARDRRLGEPDLDRLALALGGDGRQLLVDDGADGEVVGRSAHDHAVGRRRSLKASGGVDGVAGQEATTRGGVDVETHESLAGVDADAGLQRAAVGTGSALQGIEDAQAGAHRPFGVVLVHDRHAEDADHGVADELLDGAAVGLDDIGAASVVSAQEGVDVLGVRRLAHAP